MKYVVATTVTVAVLYVYALRHPGPTQPWPLWVEAVVGALIFSLPVSLLSQAATRKIGGLRARALDLLFLLLLTSVYWALTADFGALPTVVSPFRYWLRLTLTTWSTVFLPFTASLAAIEWASAWKKTLPIMTQKR